MLNLANNSPALPAQQKFTLGGIEPLAIELWHKFQNKYIIQESLNRSLVSFQANKIKSIYRWYKYKEAFSASLVEYLFQYYKITKGRILDPFAGSGTSLFVASGLGMEADGIELLPIGQNIITTRNLLESGLTENDISRLKYWSTAQPWQEVENREARYPVSKLPELRITEGAYPEETKAAIEQYISRWREESHRIQTILHFALLCIVESVSYTRKDGQYLRWDYRANRSQTSKPFDKGEILSFDRAISAKLNEIIADLQPQHEQLELFAVEKMRGKINLHPASCLDIIPGLPDSCYDAVITSPPYCNRYDYTRTYALELALLGIDDQKLSKLRQEMLSCTVENRPKDLLKINPQWETTITIAQQQELLQAILQYLEEQNKQGILNNKNIPRMVRGYFYEMACVIAECKRVMKANAPLIIVNDNVRYAGVSISVDLILSDMAEKLGFCVENILVLPDGKGNSSQQMGEHGREPLRKCIYVWRKI